MVILLEVSGRGSGLNGVDAAFDSISELMFSILSTWPLAVYFIVFGILGYFILDSREATQDYEYTESYGYMGENNKYGRKKLSVLDTDKYDHRLVSWGIISFFITATLYIFFILFNFVLAPISEISYSLAKWVFIIYNWLMSICLSINIVCIPGFLLSLSYRKHKILNKKEIYSLCSILIYILTIFAICGYLFAWPYIYDFIFPFFFPLL